LLIVGAVSVLLVKVCVAARPATVSLAPGNVIVVESVPARVSVLLTVATLPLATEKVPVVAVPTGCIKSATQP
jgi:hypothetical protein